MANRRKYIKTKIFLTGSTGYVGTKFIELYGAQFDILGVSKTDKEHPVDLLKYETLKELFVSFKPDFILHLAADVGRDTTTSNEITITNPTITENLIKLALVNKTPFLFTSTEAVYGGKEKKGEYIETNKYKPRNPYGASKVASEKLVMMSGLPYLITRGHRHVGVSKDFHKPKQFSDALHSLMNGREIHLDARKLFTPVLINNICDIFAHYIANDFDRKILINVGVNKSTTFYNFMVDVAKALKINDNLIKADGEETGWPPNSTISVKKLHKLHYPSVTYQEMLNTIKVDLDKA
ncbi:MAG TPA: NAD(P)-dependent oxidoreductase [Candidatus Saccharimonadales bacterium]|nr:NAD(P)-dependent oxidoreductase [Candidatus Saccharimonadales bacterium]